jgi:S-formylglutathione hydrolase
LTERGIGPVALEKRSESVCFGGRIGVYAHASKETGTEMKFAVYLPPAAEHAPCPALYYLAGLECTQDTFVQKAGALRLASSLGLILVAPDTSPRGAGVPGEDESWDLGTSAGFYLDATQAPWAPHYRMGSYVNEELPALIGANFPVKPGVQGIMGHSMGGHGALISALRHPGKWHSLSALAPICHPTDVPWGEKAFTAYLGPDRAGWEAFDASLLMAKQAFPGPILVDQGMADKFLPAQLRPEALERAAQTSGQALTVRRHEGYDHSYWFIQTVIADHLEHHARELGRL